MVKIGGSILRDSSSYLRVAKVLPELAIHEPSVVVVSAMKGVTSVLLHLVEDPDNLGLFKGFIDRTFASLEKVSAGERGYKKIENLQREGFNTLALLRKRRNPILADRLLSLGERASAVVMEEALKTVGINAACLTGGEAGIVTDYNYGSAKPLFEKTLPMVRNRLTKLLSAGVTPVVTGFIGVTPRGSITTFGRGGSDLTATIIGAALSARTVSLITDVPGIMSSDPEVVPEAVTLPYVSFEEANAMAKVGIKRFHPLTFKPLRGSGCRVLVRSLESPGGTMISEGVYPPPLKAISVNGVYVSVVGYGAKDLFNVLRLNDRTVSVTIGRNYVRAQICSETEALTLARRLHSLIVEGLRLVKEGVLRVR